MMPGLDGGNVAAQLRADPQLQDVPIIFLTTTVTATESAARPLLGGFPFISKPVMPARRVENIEKHLRR